MRFIILAAVILGAFGPGPAWAGSATSTVPVAVSRHAASVSGTTSPTAIWDAKGARWTMAGGQIYRNGVVDPVTAGVTLLLWYNGAIYQQTSTAWYQMTAATWPAGGTGWTLIAADPRATVVVPLALVATPPAPTIGCDITLGTVVSAITTTGGDGNAVTSP